MKKRVLNVLFTLGTPEHETVDVPKMGDSGSVLWLVPLTIGDVCSSLFLMRQRKCKNA